MREYDPFEEINRRDSEAYAREQEMRRFIEGYERRMFDEDWWCPPDEEGTDQDDEDEDEEEEEDD